MESAREKVRRKRLGGVCQEGRMATGEWRWAGFLFFGDLVKGPNEESNRERGKKVGRTKWLTLSLLLT